MTLVHDEAIHPGEVLSEVYIKPAWPPLTVAALSQALGVSQEHMVDILHGRRDITPAIAARLGVLCRTTKEYWMSLQCTYDRQSRRTQLRPHLIRRAAA